MNLFDPPGTHSGHCAHGANWAPTKTCWQSRVKTICSAQAEAVASRSPGYQAAHRPCIGHAVPKAPFLTSRPLACPFCVRAKSLRFKGTTKEACFSYWVIWIYFENANVKNIQKQCEVPAPWPSSWQQSILTRLFLRRAQYRYPSCHNVLCRRPHLFRMERVLVYFLICDLLWCESSAVSTASRSRFSVGKDAWFL